MRLASTAIIGCMVVAGCGDGDPNPESRSLTEISPPADIGSQTPTDRSGPSSVPGLAASNEAADPLKGRKALPAPGGGTFYVPVRPRTGMIAPPTGCARNDEGDLRPPRPGLKAVRVGPGRVRVRVTVGQVRAPCRPKFVRLAFDINDDPRPPGPPRSGFLTPIERFTPWRQVRLLDAVKDADVVSATGVMSSGESGDSARVLITRD